MAKRNAGRITPGQILAEWARKIVDDLKEDIFRRELNRHKALREPRRKGGQSRGRQISTRAAANDPTIKKLWMTWRNGDHLKDDYRSPVSYIREKTGLPTRTIQLRLKKLGLATTRQ